MSYESAIYEVIYPKFIKKFPQFANKVFFAGEKSRQPKKPYLMLTEINDETNHRTMEKHGVINEFKIAMVTFQINVSGVECGNNNPDNKYLAKAARDCLRAMLSSLALINELLEKGISPRFEDMSKNRDMTEPTSGGFIYIYEFDCPFEYEERTTFESNGISEGVNVEIYNKNDENAVNFEVK